MRILHRYILGSFVVAQLISLTVFTFVMCVGVVFQASDLLVRGVSLALVLRILLSGVPMVLAFAIPMSLVTSSLLLFGRLSADGEITAMKACGIGMHRILRGPLIYAAVLTLVCVYIHNNLAPRGHYMQRTMAANIRSIGPMELLDAGRFIQEFDGLTIYITRKNGEMIQGVRIFDLREPGLKREIRARTGVVTVEQSLGILRLDLFDVRVNPVSKETPTEAYCGRLSMVISDAFKTKKYRKKRDDMTFPELFAALQEVDSTMQGMAPDAFLREKTAYKVEASRRMALSAACFAFTLLGIPLGIRAHRKESSIGVAISLCLVLVFYMFFLVAQSLIKYPQFHPEFLVWAPVIAAVGLGIFLVRRVD